MLCLCVRVHVCGNVCFALCIVHPLRLCIWPPRPFYTILLSSNYHGGKWKCTWASIRRYVDRLKIKKDTKNIQIRNRRWPNSRRTRHDGQCGACCVRHRASKRCRSLVSCALLVIDAGVCSPMTFNSALASQSPCIFQNAHFESKSSFNLYLFILFIFSLHPSFHFCVACNTSAGLINHSTQFYGKFIGRAVSAMHSST